MTSSVKPSEALTLEAIAMSPLDDGDDDVMWLDWEQDAAVVAVAVSVVGTLFRVVRDVAISGTAVTVDVTTTVVVSVLLGDVEPDIRSKMTLPASMVKGDELP